jgi:hypothetical protein
MLTWRSRRRCKTHSAKWICWITRTGCAVELICIGGANLLDRMHINSTGCVFTRLEAQITRPGDLQRYKDTIYVNLPAKVVLHLVETHSTISSFLAVESCTPNLIRPRGKHPLNRENTNTDKILSPLKFTQMKRQTAWCLKHYLHYIV